MHVGLNASSVALTTLHLAIAASPDADMRNLVSGMGGDSAIGVRVEPTDHVLAAHPAP